MMAALVDRAATADHLCRVGGVCPSTKQHPTFGQYAAVEADPVVNLLGHRGARRPAR